MNTRGRPSYGPDLELTYNRIYCMLKRYPVEFLTTSSWGWEEKKKEKDSWMHCDADVDDSASIHKCQKSIL